MISFILFKAISKLSSFGDAIFKIPLSPISIFEEDVSHISLITFPDGPMISLIFSFLILRILILGAFSAKVVLGFEIAFSSL